MRRRDEGKELRLKSNTKRKKEGKKEGKKKRGGNKKTNEQEKKKKNKNKKKNKKKNAGNTVRDRKELYLLSESGCRRFGQRDTVAVQGLRRVGVCAGHSRGLRDEPVQAQLGRHHLEEAIHHRLRLSHGQERERVRERVRE